ncbi:MAG: B12-binding domain-containing radical SAM protein [Erysipelotrichales bacterium]|nr:B12-binding domain-containing radical SAM protein [Erysipelotrichales bacterium]
MKIALVAINAKYIHKNLAVRFLKENCDYPTDILEYTIKSDVELIYQELLNYELIGFSCYIWNIDIITKLCQRIRNNRPSIKILFGGPEVSYEYQEFFDNNLIDFLIKEEGEQAFNELVSCIVQKKSTENIAGLVTKKQDNPVAKPDLLSIKLPYKVIENNNLYYLEFTRGCKFKCSYCLASTTNHIRYYDQEAVKAAITEVVKGGAKMIKFLDRNFTADQNFAENIFNWLLQFQNYPVSFQFEVNLDLLSTEYLEKINKNLRPGFFRFEVGIQTLNEKSNKAISRKQNNEKLLENLRLLNKSNIICHADLICGLPDDNYHSFIETFNSVLKTKPKELQCGFLKSLKGTKLRKESAKYGYVFIKEAPYTIVKSNSFSEAEIKSVMKTEEALEVLYNKNYMPLTFDFLIESQDNCFKFLEGFSSNLKKQELDKLFFSFDQYLETIYPELYAKAHELLVEDYLRFFKMRPVFWFKEILNKKEKNRLIADLNDFSYSKDFLYRYAHIAEFTKFYLIVIYNNQESKLIKYWKT